MTLPATPVRQLRSRSRALVRELSAFGTVGLVCFVIDIGLFQLLYAQLGLGAVTAKLAATLISMTVAYVAHRHWSFQHRPRIRVPRQYLMFLAVNGSTLLLGLAVVAVVRYPLAQDSSVVLQLANVGSIAIGTVVRWLAYRNWVFPALAPAPSPAERDDARVVA